ncbi:uncharacterized protein LOC125195141 [Salvia hispanica]|uniref:uncharacterized protein LOC125195141 n=1 Tax=Salvia hispanica TaxID=49212 RepID=UPI002009905E|nr:uncharacterized protein LOC125195141 [Salvia hispanica]
MRRSLFLRIVNALSARYPEFRLQRDATGKLSVYRPCRNALVAIRQLAYGGSADMFDEYLQCGETTGNECLKNFCQGVREIFGEHYLRSPDAADCQFLLDWHWRTHGFPGMLGKHRLYALAVEELPNRVARPVHYRLQRYASHHHS